jgi:hypothetical protein
MKNSVRPVITACIVLVPDFLHTLGLIEQVVTDSLAGTKRISTEDYFSN